MAAFSLAVDGNPVVVACTDRHAGMSLWVDGQQTDKELAQLKLSSTSPPLITWADMPLRSGQVVTVAFLDHAASCNRGKTAEERFQERKPGQLAEMLSDFGKDYRTEPKLRSKYTFRIAMPTGLTYEIETQPDDFGFFFSVRWDSRSPRQAKVSLSTFTVDELYSLEMMGEDKFAEDIHFGEAVRFEVS